MVTSLLKQSLNVIAQQVLLDLASNPASWQTQNGYFVRNPVGPLAGLVATPFWIVVRNHIYATPAIADIPTFGPNDFPTVIISAQLMVFVPGPSIGGHKPDNVIVRQMPALLGLPLATRQNQVVAAWKHSSFDGITQV